MAEREFRAKKRLRNEATWRKKVTKRLKAEGIEHLRHDGVSIHPQRIIHDEDCRHFCRNKLTAEEKLWILQKFNQLADHDIQNAYLQGCLPDKNKQVEYKLRLSDRTQFVCQKYFLCVHGVKKSRLRRKVLRLDLPNRDGRGRHDNHRTTEENILNSVRNFFNGLPARESHYSRERNPHKRYLESSTTIRSLYNSFLDANPNPAENEPIIQYWQFRKIFNYQYNIGLGYPRSDVCEVCDINQAKLTSILANRFIDENEEYEVRITQEYHWAEAQAFISRMGKPVIETYDETHDFICFDYQKNLAFPTTNIGKEFFLRQLWLFNFCIHNLRNGNAYMFVYPENFAKKSSNETVSFLKYYIENFVNIEVRNIHMFADNNFGQNKNRYLMTYLASLVPERFDNIYLHFPLPGHSRMQCDADFAIIEKKKRKCDKVHFPMQWINLIRAARPSNPFNVLYVENYPTNGLISDGTPIVPVYDFKAALNDILRPPAQINEIRRLHIDRELKVTVNPEIENGTWTEFFFLKRRFDYQILKRRVLNVQRAYNGYLPISTEKFDNVMYLLSTFYRAPEDIFYESIDLQLDVPDHIVDIIEQYPEPNFDFAFLDIEA